jgi:hypothetical protein
VPRSWIQSNRLNLSKERFDRKDEPQGLKSERANSDPNSVPQGRLNFAELSPGR